MRENRAVVDDSSTRVIHPEAVRAGRAKIPPADDLESMEGFFKVLGDTTRLRIIHALLGAELCVHDLAETLGMSISAVSHQLAVLKTARVVRHRRDGKVVYYRLSDAHVRALMGSVRTHVRE